MKRIVLACGSGIVTSTTVRAKIEKHLDANGFKGEYKIDQCKISEVLQKAKSADFVISTTMPPVGLDKPFVRAVSLLTGVGADATLAEITELMKK